MNDSPYQQMAKEFMDLWQKQIASVVSDKQFISAMLDLLKTASDPQKSSYDRYKPNAAANAAHASDANGGVLAELAFRVAMCEKRLASLESAGGTATQKRKPAAKKTGTSHKRGSKKPRS